MLTNEDRLELDRVLTPMLERLTAIEERLNERDDAEAEVVAEGDELLGRIERAEAMLNATTAAQRHSVA